MTDKNGGCIESRLGEIGDAAKLVAGVMIFPVSIERTVEGRFDALVIGDKTDFVRDIRIRANDHHSVRGQVVAARELRILPIV